MALDQRKYERKHTDVLRDIRPAYVRVAEWAGRGSHAGTVFFMTAFAVYQFPNAIVAGDLIFFLGIIYFFWVRARDRSLAFKLPYGAKFKDKRNEGPGLSGKGEGILYVGNVKDTKEEAWFSNSDARTHILYLGTTGSGKTEGLKSMVTNALTWGSGFIYVDGKADTDLWSSLSALVRRFGRDDDLLVLNYMTGNSNSRAPSNTMNPFSSGSASYLTNMMVTLMPDAEGDNAMWKERAVALLASLMPALTWKRDYQEIPMSVSTIRSYLNLNNVIKLSRDEALPPELRAGVKGYLDTLPGYVDAAFDNEGKEKPAGPDQPQYDTTTPRQQHGYLSMQFTRSLQSLGDEYGYIFDTQAADVDMIDCVLNRRILVVLIPALEKSSDETANLGKIVSATLKGMMGSTLGSTVEGESSTVIENKPTNSATPFMTVFDEVGYYTAQGMAVMAAQARSLGFCLIYSAQDLPAMEKRVKEEARSITANCNIKIFGKLEDPTQTKEFFEKTVGTALVMESTGFQLQGGRGTGSYYDNMGASLQLRARASYDGLKALKSGEAVVCFGDRIVDTMMFYSNPGHAKAMRVTRFVALPPPDENVIKHANIIAKVRDLMVHKTWTAAKAEAKVDTPAEIDAMAKTMVRAKKANRNPTECGMIAVVGVHALNNPIEPEKTETTGGGGSAPAVQKPQAAPPPAPGGSTPPLAAPPRTPPVQQPPPAKAPVTAAATPAAPPPPPAQKPVVTAAAPPSTAAADAATAANPMAFFTKGKPAGAETQPPAAAPPAGTPGAPISWDKLVPQEPAKQPPATPPAAPPAAAQPPPAAPAQQPPPSTAGSSLDPQSRDIIGKAGKDLGDMLFKGKKDDGDGKK
ncbi:MAG TPA: type IV secretion system DNA-binding domain-containing protein [Patescibacteria group bacterium]|nr:type IV secretion system DNA-binding domain-containing protein [Patescibacteria group bacterium]